MNATGVARFWTSVLHFRAGKAALNPRSHFIDFSHPRIPSGRDPAFSSKRGPPGASFMAAVLLTLGLFIFWLALGYAVLTPLRQFDRLGNLLAAPVVGLACTLLTLFFLSRAGLAIGRVAWPVFLGLGATTIFLLWRIKPGFDVRSYAPFAGVLLAGLFLTGRPLLEFGFNWLSYCNCDMANYCLRAQRFLHHGFNEPPTEEELIHGRDSSQFLWFSTVGCHQRAGTDLVLAWVARLTCMTPHQVFMPLMIALHLLLISSAGALAYGVGAARGVAWWTCVLMAASSLTTLGTVYQLIAQVVGLSLVAGCALVLFRPPPAEGADLRRRGIAAGLLGAALIASYPEICPFIGIGYFLYLIVTVRQWWPARTALAGSLAVAGLLTALVLNIYLIHPGQFMVSQMHHGDANIEISSQLFPYFLVPSGLANFWGLVPLSGGSVGGRMLGALVLLGGSLIALAVYAASRLAWRGHPAALVCWVMMVVAVWLSIGPDAFGLFKLAMFIQPFLLATLVAWVWGIPWRTFRTAVFTALALAGLSTQAWYVQASRGSAHVFAEVADASAGQLNDQLAQLANAKPSRVILDTYGPALSLFQAAALRGSDCAVVGPNRLIGGATEARGLYEPGLENLLKARASSFKSLLLVHHFNLHLPDRPDETNYFRLTRIGHPPTREIGKDFLVRGTPLTTVLNRWNVAANEKRHFILQSWEDVHNHLVFQNSNLGEPNYGFRHSDNVALHSLERDFFYPDRTMAGAGRHLLFQVLNPAARLRVRLDFTASLMADGVCRLPSVKAIGAKRVGFPLVGRGSARVYSDPIAPQFLDGDTLLGLDMGMDGKRFVIPRLGVMRWYGSHIPVDWRKIVGFFRDVSALSEAEYQALRPPQQLQKFPEDLLHRDLEYSGCYEDGWTSEAMWFSLWRPNMPAELVVRGMVPEINDPTFSTEAVLRVDGEEIARKVLKTGDFEWRVAAPSGAGRSKVEMQFSRWQTLPGKDGRPVVALINFVGFTNATTTNLARFRRKLDKGN
jgi:hypothetical protein